MHCVLRDSSPKRAFFYPFSHFISQWKEKLGRSYFKSEVTTVSLMQTLPFSKSCVNYKHLHCSGAWGTRQEGAYYPSTSCLCLFPGRMRRKNNNLKTKAKRGNKAESLYPVSLLMSFGNCSLNLFHCTRTVKEEIRGIPTTTTMCLSVLVNECVCFLAGNSASCCFSVNT